MKILITILFSVLGLAGNSQLSSIVIRNDTTFSFNPSTGVYTQLNKFWPTDSVPLRTAAGLSTGLPYGTTAQYLRGNFSLATFPTTTASFTNSTNKNFVTDAQLVVIGNTSNTNSGDNAVNSTYASDYRAANFIAGTNYLAPNGSAASLTNFPTLNQNTSGTAAGLSANIAESQVTNLISDLAAKQATLVSGSNIKTVNGTTLLGSTDITTTRKVAQADIASTASATSTTTLFTPSASGMYRVSIYLKITTTGTSPVAGPVTITYTEPDGSVAQSHVMLLQSVTGSVVTTTVNNSTTTGTVNGSMVIYAKTGVAIQYAIAVSGTFGAGRYIAHISCEQL